MPTQTIPADLERFRSPLPAIAAVLYALAASSGLVGAVLLLDPGSRAALTEDVILSGILERSAVSSWQLIHGSIGLLAFLCPALLAVGIGLALKGRVHKGMTLLHGLAKGLHIAVAVTGTIALAVLIFRLGRYILLCLGVNGGAYLLYTMVMSEAIMVVQAFLLYKLLRRFLLCARECAAGIGYTLSTGALDRTTWPAFAATGLLILGILCAVLAADRLFTLTIVDSFPADYYAVLTTKDPIQLFTGCALFL
ncbi:MAG: hypothetical protein IJA71_05310, partial [Clostridia bacterium]|nr:hypothetical protein [Clostridia bacterium]